MFKVLEDMFVTGRDGISYLFEAVGIYSILRYLTRNKVMILMYHGVTTKESIITNCDHRHVELKKFLWQMEYLKKRYYFISFSDFMAWRNGKLKKLPPNPVIITFDDGYKNNYTQLFPILKRNKLPAMVYLQTGMIGKKNVAEHNIIQYCINKTNKKEIVVRGKKYSLRSTKEKISAVHLLRNAADKESTLSSFLAEIEKQTAVVCSETEDEDFGFMTWVQCKEMQKQGVEFGSHTDSHPVLTRVDLGYCQQELKKAKEILCQRLGPTYHFCYPYGSYNDHIIRIVKEYYDTAVIIKHGYNTKKSNFYKLKRIPITSRNTNWSFVLDLFCNASLFHHWLIICYSYLKKV
jgi:peptidoglycan/xylan/chitin deacetylase (PgdA/CDA1 family)